MPVSLKEPLLVTIESFGAGGASARFRVVVLDPESQRDRGDPRLG